MRKFVAIMFIAALAGCKASLSGDLKVYNDTHSDLTVKYVGFESSDTLVKLVSHHGSATLHVIDGSGNKKTFDCCPCELKWLSISSPSGTIKKDPTKKENWTIPNKDNLKKYGKEAIKCEFRVGQADL